MISPVIILIFVVVIASVEVSSVCDCTCDCTAREIRENSEINTNNVYNGTSVQYNSNCTTNEDSNKFKSSKRTRGKYLGCFLVSAEHRGLRGYVRSSSSNTVENCIDICRNGNYVYAGLQAGSWCLCGNTNQDRIMNKKLRDSDCYSPCTGNASQMCGNSWIQAIYETGIEQFLIDEEGRQRPESYIKPSSHSYFYLYHDGAVEN